VTLCLSRAKRASRRGVEESLRNRYGVIPSAARDLLFDLSRGLPAVPFLGKPDPSAGQSALSYSKPFKKTGLSFCNL